MVNWTDPYFLDSNFSLGLSGFYYNRFFTDWDEERAGGRITVGRQLTQALSINGALRLETVTLDNPDVPTPLILQESLGDNFLSTFRPSIAHDTRDSAFLPGEGHYIELAYEQAFGDFSYPRAELEARQFFTLYTRPDGDGRHTLTVGGQLGWTDDDTPIFERFYAGGFQTFRGFDFRGVSPRELDVRVGGNWLMLGTVEYMLPLLANEMIHGVVFSDFGTVEEDPGFEDFRVTAGLGFRVTIPAMGPVPLAFDFAFPIAKQDEDDTRIFSFYVGVQR
jgi:outer membrane protein insertion porin family